MKYARQTLFYAVIGIFIATALITLLGVAGIIEIKEAYLNTLFSALIVELVAAVVGLFKSTDWFGAAGNSLAESPVVGAWWQLLRHADSNGISFVEIKYSVEQRQFVIEGEAYSVTGQPFARWWTIGVAYNAATNEMHYLWTGDHESSDEDFSGVGYFKFNGAHGDKKLTEGVGWFTKGNIGNLSITAKQKLELTAVSKEHESIMAAKESSRSEKGKIAASVYANWAGIKAGASNAEVEKTMD